MAVFLDRAKLNLSIHVQNGIDNAISKFIEQHYMYYLHEHYSEVFNAGITEALEQIMEERARSKNKHCLITVPYTDDNLEYANKFCRRKVLQWSCYTTEVSKKGFKHIHIACKPYAHYGICTMRKWVNSTFKAKEQNITPDVRWNPDALDYIQKQGIVVWVRHNVAKESKKLKNKNLDKD